MATGDAKSLYKMMDANGDGQVDYNEFITAATNREKMINDKNMKMLFKMFD